MVWVIVIGVIVLAVYLMCKSGKTEEKTKSMSSYTPPTFAPPRTAVSPTVKSAEKPIIKKAVGYIPIYEYTARGYTIRCPHCDGENPSATPNCQICGNQIGS